MRASASGDVGPQAPECFRLLFVCTGNICRSPLAERLTRHFLAETLGEGAGAFEVASAGTHGLDGHPMDEDAARVLATYGGSACGFRARPLAEGDLRAADLVVGMERAHRAEAARRVPKVLRRSFTLRELARLAGADKDGERSGAQPDGTLDPEGPALTRVESARRAVARVAALRGTLAPVAGAEDVEDPIGGPPALHARVGGEIAESLRPVVALLAGTRPPASA